MNSAKNVLVIFLAAAVVAIAALSWHQYQELLDLRAQLADGNVAMLKKELTDAHKSIKSLEDRLAAARGRRGAGEEGDEAAENGPPPRRGGRFAAFAAMAANPAFQKLASIAARGRIVQTYGPLFKSLNLSPEQLQQFESLLADKQQAMMDVMQAAREQGISPRSDPDGFKTLLNQAVAQTDASIQQTLGDSGFQEYQQYQQTLPERNTVNSLQQSLSYTSTPLTDDEANQMISLLQQSQPQHSGNGTAGTSNGGQGAGPSIQSLMNGGGTAKVTDESLTQAQGVLSAPQISALQQIQQQQQAQQQMQQMMRASFQGGNGGAAPAAPAAGGGKG